MKRVGTAALVALVWLAPIRAALAQTSNGIITTIAGTGVGVFGGDGGSATAAGLSDPERVAIDSAGNVYIADEYRVRKITPAGIISTIAGNGTDGFSGDGGPAVSAQLRAYAVAVDLAGNLFVADRDNNRVRKVTPAGIISTVAGNGTAGFSGDGGPALAAALRSPRGVAVDAAGNLFIGERGNNRIRRVNPQGIITTVAGNGQAGFGGDGGPAVSGLLNGPEGIAIDSTGTLFIADTNNHRIRKVSPQGIITTIAGSSDNGFSGDGGPATAAMLENPEDVAVDSTGTLFIADRENNRVRKVTSAGIITTVAGGESGFSGDGGPSSSALLNDPSGVAVAANGSLFIADNDNYRVRKITFSQPLTYVINNRGGRSLMSSGSSESEISTGYARIQPNAGNTTPSGLAIFGFRTNGVLVSEAGVSASALIQSGRIFAEIGGTVNTGLAIVNPNSQVANVSFYFTDTTGSNFGAGSTTIPANSKIAAFLNQSPFVGRASLSGTFTFSSSVPVSAVALRGLTNERGDFLITTLPVTDLALSIATGTIIFPDFVDGAGWTTQIILINPGDTTLSGTVQFQNQNGAPVAVTANSQSNSTFAYSISARSSLKLVTAGTTSPIAAGSVFVVPAANTATPSGLAVFSYRTAGTTVSEAGVPASPAGNAFRLYAETAGVFGTIGSIQTGLAVVNTSSSAATVSLELARLDGSSTGLTGSFSVPSNGQASKFLNEISGLGSLPTPFQGVLRVSSSSSISVVGLRGRYNERGDFLITTIPPVNEVSAASNGPLYFPHIADSGGYTTQFILFSGAAGQSSSGSLQLLSTTGTTLNWNVQ